MQLGTTWRGLAFGSIFTVAGVGVAVADEPKPEDGGAPAAAAAPVPAPLDPAVLPVNQQRPRDFAPEGGKRKPADGAAEAAEPTSSRIKIGGITIRGLVRGDIMYDDTQPATPQIPFTIPTEQRSAGGLHNRGDLTAHARNSRLWFEVDPIALKGLEGWTVRALLDLDLGALIPTPNLLREAYIDVRGPLGPGEIRIIGGQAWDLISAHRPSFSAETFLWAVGNVGTVRPQLRGEYVYKVNDKTSIVGGLMIGASGAFDGQDLDGNGLLDGEVSERPTIQLRGAFRMQTNMGKSPVEVGLWLHGSQLHSNARLGTRANSHWEGRAMGVDAMVPVMKTGEGENERDHLWFMAQLWTGKCVSDIGGGIFQSVNPGTAEEVHANGMWVECNFGLTQTFTIRGGWSLDDPVNEDLRIGGAGSPSRNHAVFGGITINYHPWQFGVEIYHWETQYIGVRRGIDNRIKVFTSFEF